MATTSKKINLEQLDQELGSQGLVANFEDENNKIIKPSDDSKVTEKELEKAIAAHVAQPSTIEVTELNREEGKKKMIELGFTPEQISALGL
jgi:hypothetical protein